VEQWDPRSGEGEGEDDDDDDSSDDEDYDEEDDHDDYEDSSPTGKRRSSGDTERMKKGKRRRIDHGVCFVSHPSTSLLTESMT
jgi:hypothetical protein